MLGEFLHQRYCDLSYGTECKTDKQYTFSLLAAEGFKIIIAHFVVNILNLLWVLKPGWVVLLPALSLACAW